MATVASEGREPDFFELLRATILDGSLGQSTSDGVNRGVTSSAADAQGANTFPDLHMSNKALHVLSIGACIIDQADPDSIPTRIQVQPSGASVWWTAYGVESLPYITEIYPITGMSPEHTNQWATYLLFQLWNPHIGALPIPAPQVRLRVDGSIGIFSDGGAGQPWTTAATKQPFTIPSAGVAIPLTSGALPPGSTPTPLSTPPAGVAAMAPPRGDGTQIGFEILPGTSIQQYIGLRLPDFPLGPGSPANPVLNLYFGHADATNQQFNVTMEYNPDGGTTWVPYNHFVGIIDRNITTGTGSWMNGATVPVRQASLSDGTPTSAADPFDTTRLTFNQADCLMKADPRATRFGIFQFNRTAAVTAPRLTDSLWPTGSALPTGYGGTTANPDGSAVVKHAPLRFVGPPYFPATFCINNALSTSTRTSYQDEDGVTIRPADATYTEAPATGSFTGSATPYDATSMDYHPIMLNRPFRNVAELGYAFRDLPWKTLDFFTDKSADAGLLDIFTINDGAPLFDTSNPLNIIGMAPPTIAATSVNLNSTQTADLQSILAGTILNELDSTNTIAKTDTGATSAPEIAANIVSAMNVAANPSATPGQNRSELITRSGLPTSILPVPSSGAALHDQRVKSRREVVARAVSSVSQTRVWNLLIDVVAQTGHYKPNAISLDDFIVEGEKRYWLHVAIDRFTGQVIDKQTEVVKE